MERQRERDNCVRVETRRKERGYWGNRYNTIQFDAMIDFFFFERERTVIPYVRTIHSLSIQFPTPVAARGLLDPVPINHVALRIQYPDPSETRGIIKHTTDMTDPSKHSVTIERVHTIWSSRHVTSQPRLH